MASTYMDTTGDGVNEPHLSVNIGLSDTNGGSVAVSGTVQLVGASPVAVTGSPVTAPAAPGSGSIYWNINVDAGNSGVATVQQSTSADPPPLNSTSVIVYRETLTAATTDPALDPTQSTPDLF